MEAIRPHGGALVHQHLTWRAEARMEGAKPLLITEESAWDIWNISEGIYSPLRGPMSKEVAATVAKERFLPQAGCPTWTIPVMLPVLNKDSEEWRRLRPREICRQLEGGTFKLWLCKPTGDGMYLYPTQDIGAINVTGAFTLDKKWLGYIARLVYGPAYKTHPGAAPWLKLAGRIAVTGVAWGGSLQPEGVAREAVLLPVATRAIFKRRKWRTIAGYQIRNAPHRGHEQAMKTALEVCDGLFVNPVLGPKKPGDFSDATIYETNRALLDHYFPAASTLLGVLHYGMRYAGPKEAIHHAIMRQNYGCTHIVIGRDHAGASLPDGTPIYKPYEAQQKFDKLAGADLLIEPINLQEFYHCSLCPGIVTEKTCPHRESGSIGRYSGTEIRRLIQAGTRPPRWMMRPEVADKITETGQSGG